MNTTRYETSPSLLSAEERLKAADYLAQTRDNLLETVTGLTDSQWHFKPAADRWSIAEILEHLVLVEGGVQGRVERMQEEPLADPDRNNAEVESIILTEIPRRSPKYKAPPQITPSREWSPAELLDRFLERRAATIELLAASPALRGHVAPHPIKGPWDGYQWILAAAAHTARHTDQILEVKADASFPATEAARSVSLH